MNWDILVEFARASKQQIGDPWELIVELCVIDMERHWQHWATLNLDVLPRADVMDRFNALPRSGTYRAAALAGEEGHFSEIQLNDLQRAEMKARQKYGDLPHPSEFQVELSNRELEKIKRPTVSILIDGIESYRTKVWGTFQVGRQAKGEPRAPSFYEFGEEDKLICADGMDPSISRDQARIQLLSNRFSKVENQSTNRGFSINEMIETNPGSSVVVKLPLTIQLGKIEVTLQRTT